MEIIVRNSRGMSLIPVKSQLLSERKVFIEGEITDDMANEFMQVLMYLMREDGEAPISIYIDSPGGAVQAGLKMYDLIRALEVEVNLYCTGMAASMAAILLAGGQKGRRFILPHAKVMIHEPLIAGGVGGSATSIQKTAESIMETKRLTVDQMSADTGKSRKEVEEAVAFDNYMNAQEAVAFGIVDAVVTSVFERRDFD